MLSHLKLIKIIQVFCWNIAIAWVEIAFPKVCHIHNYPSSFLKITLLNYV